MTPMVERELESDAVPADPVLAQAVEFARSAAVEVGGSDVGEHVGVRGEVHEAGMGHAATHLFRSTLPGYVGWCWAVTVARPEHGTDPADVTVDEVVLVAGEGAILAPEWVPWSRRVSAEDMGPGDVLVTEPDDDRLVPGYLMTGDPVVDDVALELGLGRPRVMSRSGRLETAERWHGGDHGPRTAMARHAPAACGTCGFFLPLAGSLRSGFGACGNLLSPADGHVVAVDFGCGAHSEAVAPAEPEAPTRPSYDTQEYDELTPDEVDTEPALAAGADGTEPATAVTETPETGTAEALETVAPETDPAGTGAAADNTPAEATTGAVPAEAPVGAAVETEVADTEATESGATENEAGRPEPIQSEPAASPAEAVAPAPPEAIAAEAAEAATADPGAVGSGPTDTAGTDSGTAEEGTAEHRTAEPGAVDSGTTDSATTDSGTTDSGTTDSGTTDSATTDSETAEAAQPAPSDSGS